MFTWQGQAGTKTVFRNKHPLPGQSLNRFVLGNMFARMSKFVDNVWSNITIEPVMAMYCLIIALSGIPGEELYLKKACKVNLNHSAEICDNIYDYEAAQMETQKLVSVVQVNIAHALLQ